MLDRYFPLYITVFLISMVFTIIIEKRLIPLFAKNAKQPIYEEGPRWHISKSGTPTMGGVAFVIAATVSLLTSSLILLLTKSYDAVITLVICQLYAISNAFVGAFDDIKKLKRQKNKGLSAKGKLILQTISGIIFLYARSILINNSTSLSFSFGNIDLGIFYYPVALIVLVGIVNCANLTDGIDGLASSVAFSIGISLFYICSALSTEGATIAAAIIGASIGFLVFNLYPAKIFMGDTGSLYFGALIGSAAFVIENPILILFISGVYVLEGLSVIVQVVSYKIRGKRIFKMAPIHHHLEKCGWSENRICIVAMLLTFLFSIPAYIFYLP